MSRADIDSNCKHLNGMPTDGVPTDGLCQYAPHSGRTYTDRDGRFTTLAVGVLPLPELEKVAGSSGSSTLGSTLAEKSANDIKEVAEVAGVAPKGGKVPHKPSGDPAEVKPDLDLLLDQVVSVLRRFLYLRPDRYYYEAITLWIVATHVFGYSNIFPRLMATSPEPDCGKSTLMKISSALSHKSFITSKATQPAILRKIKSSKSDISIFLDDAENYADETVTTLLNSGFDRFGGSALICEPTKSGAWKEVEFNTYCPIAIGRIGKMTIRSTQTRCIEINVPKAKPSEVPERFNPDVHNKQLKKLQEDIAQWAAKNGQCLKGYDPKMPAELINRNADLWRFMIAISDLAGARWQGIARHTATIITNNTETPSNTWEFRIHIEQVLILAREARHEWDKLGIGQVGGNRLRISSDAFCTLLGRANRKYQSLTKEQLAVRLKKFDIKPSSLKLSNNSNKVLRGYKEEDLRDVLERYGGVGEGADTP